MRQYRRITIRELMLVALFATVGIAALSTGGRLASVFAVISFLVTVAFTIIALIGRGRARVWAVGFIVPIIAYAATFAAMDKGELDPYAGVLPTTRILQPVYESVVRRSYIDPRTGKPATETSNENDVAGTLYSMVTIETPDRPTFMALGHILFAIMFGYAGARFAMWVHEWPLPTKITPDIEK